jgi:hypothetical protein
MAPRVTPQYVVEVKYNFAEIRCLYVVIIDVTLVSIYAPEQ